MYAYTVDINLQFVGHFTVTGRFLGELSRWLSGTAAQERRSRNFSNFSSASAVFEPSKGAEERWVGVVGVIGVPWNSDEQKKRRTSCGWLFTAGSTKLGGALWVVIGLPCNLWQPVAWHCPRCLSHPRSSCDTNELPGRFLRVEADGTIISHDQEPISSNIKIHLPRIKQHQWTKDTTPAWSHPRRFQFFWLQSPTATGKLGATMVNIHEDGLVMIKSSLLPLKC